MFAVVRQLCRAPITWLARSGIALVGLCSLGWLASGVAAAAMLTYRMQPRFEEPAPDGFEPLRIRTEDGLTIGAWLGRAEGSRGGAVLVHGNGGSRSEVIDHARLLRDMGLDSMPITVRAHGDSDGDQNDIGWSARHDVAAAVRRLREIEGGRPVLVLGLSLGAAAAVFAAPELGRNVNGYVLVAPYADLDRAVARRTARYLPPALDAIALAALRVGGRFVLPDLDGIAPARVAPSMPAVPVLIIAGGADDRAPESDAREIAAGLARAGGGGPGARSRGRAALAGRRRA